MKQSLREALADSHIAAVTIALLLFSSVDCTFRAVWPYAFEAISFIFTAVAIWDIPYFSFDGVNRLQLVATLSYLYSAIVEVLAAWLMSRWIYGVGPVRSLIEQRRTLTRTQHAEV